MTKLEQKKQDELLLIAYMAGHDACKKHFDSRTCDRCKYSEESSEAYALVCDLGIEDGEHMSGFSLVEEDFGCNKWEQKDA